MWSTVRALFYITKIHKLLAKWSGQTRDLMHFLDTWVWKGREGYWRKSEAVLEKRVLAVRRRLTADFLQVGFGSALAEATSPHGDPKRAGEAPVCPVYSAATEQATGRSSSSGQSLSPIWISLLPQNSSSFQKASYPVFNFNHDSTIHWWDANSSQGSQGKWLELWTKVKLRIWNWVDTGASLNHWTNTEWEEGSNFARRTQGCLRHFLDNKPAQSWRPESRAEQRLVLASQSKWYAYLYPLSSWLRTIVWGVLTSFKRESRSSSTTRKSHHSWSWNPWQSSSTYKKL